MTLRLCAAILITASLFAAGAASADPSGDTTAQHAADPLLGLLPGPQPTSPSWAQLRGTMLVFDEARWKRQPAKLPGFRSFVVSSSALVIGFHEVLEPANSASADALLAEMEKNQRANFLRFEKAPAGSPLTALKWPSGGACGHFQGQAQGGQPVWYSHCIFVRDEQVTYLNVVAPLDVQATDVAAINEVLATVRPRSWRTPTDFNTQPFPDVKGVPVTLHLRLPERFVLSKNEYSTTTIFCDRDDAMQFGQFGPADESSCVEIRIAPGETYSPENGRFKSEDMIGAMGGQIHGVQVTSSKRTIHDRPVLDIAMHGADRVAHVLLIADSDRVVEVDYTEPTGVGAEGYDAIWRELLDGL
jgi:hypothetical protein